jgi:hypothetical protein
MKLLHGQRLDEARPHARRDHGLAIRLVQVARHFCEEFAVGDSGRRIEACDLLDPGANDRSDLGRNRDTLLVLGDVEIGFIERQRLDQVGVLGEDLANLGSEQEQFKILR